MCVGTWGEKGLRDVIVGLAHMCVCVECVCFFYTCVVALSRLLNFKWYTENHWKLLWQFTCFVRVVNALVDVYVYKVFLFRSYLTMIHRLLLPALVLQGPCTL